MFDRFPELVKAAICEACCLLNGLDGRRRARRSGAESPGVCETVKENDRSYLHARRPATEKIGLTPDLVRVPCEIGSVQGLDYRKALFRWRCPILDSQEVLSSL